MRRSILRWAMGAVATGVVGGCAATPPPAPSPAPSPPEALIPRPRVRRLMLPRGGLPDERPWWRRDEIGPRERYPAPQGGGRDSLAKDRGGSTQQ